MGGPPQRLREPPDEPPVERVPPACDASLDPPRARAYARRAEAPAITISTTDIRASLTGHPPVKQVDAAHTDAHGKGPRGEAMFASICRVPLRTGRGGAPLGRTDRLGGRFPHSVIIPRTVAEWHFPSTSALA